MPVDPSTRQNQQVESKPPPADFDGLRPRIHLLSSTGCKPDCTCGLERAGASASADIRSLNCTTCHQQQQHTPNLRLQLLQELYNNKGLVSTSHIWHINLHPSHTNAIYMRHNTTYFNMPLCTFFALATWLEAGLPSASFTVLSLQHCSAFILISCPRTATAQIAIHQITS